MKLLYIVLGILIPPLGVFLAFGVSSTLFINILLTLLDTVLSVKGKQAKNQFPPLKQR
jgi:uncharacterized membrane protein YqaE (UPF0057 family)